MSKLKQHYSQQLIDIRYQSSWEDYDYQYSQWMARKNPPTGIMAKVRDFLIGKPVDGEDIINIVPKYALYILIESIHLMKSLKTFRKV
jgi:hypothetical protein